MTLNAGNPPSFHKPLPLVPDPPIDIFLPLHGAVITLLGEYAGSVVYVPGLPIGPPVVFIDGFPAAVIRLLCSKLTIIADNAVSIVGQVLQDPAAGAFRDQKKLPR